MNRTLPNWVELAQTCEDREDVAILLEQIYNQGYYAGKIDADSEWWIRQDADMQLNDDWSESAMTSKASGLSDDDGKKT